MLDLGAAEQLRGVEPALVELAGIVGRDDGEHAGHSLGVGEIDRGDSSLGNRRADHIAIGRVRNDIVAFVSIARAAGGLERTIDAIGGLADHLELVDRVCRGGGFEFHVSAFRFSQHRA